MVVGRETLMDWLTYHGGKERLLNPRRHTLDFDDDDDYHLRVCVCQQLWKNTHPS